MTEPLYDRDPLNHLLDTAQVDLRLERVQRLRRSILTAIPLRSRWSFIALVTGEPALFLATALLGFFLGAAVPFSFADEESGGGGMPGFEQSFLEGDLG